MNSRLIRAVKRQMRTLFILSLIFLVSSVGASENSVKKVLLENGLELHIKEILSSRILPHAFYDQAMASIPGVYPKSQSSRKDAWDTWKRIHLLSIPCLL